MYTGTSAAFNKKITETGRTLKAKLVCGSESVETGFKSIKVYAQANEDTETISIGGTVSTYAEISIFNPSVMFTGKEYTLFIGVQLDDGRIEYCQIGKFTAQKPKEEDGLYSFTAYDRMVSKFEKPYITEIKKYPADGKEILQEIVTKAGVTFANLDSLPDGIMIDRRIIYDNISENNISARSIAPFSGFTFRESVMYLAQIYGKFATINRDGNLEFRWYHDTNYKVFANRSYDDIVCAETVYHLQKITCTVGEDKYVCGDGITGISIENPVMTNEMLVSAFNRIKDFTYLPTTVSFSGDPRIELGDIVTVYKRDGTAIKVPLMGVTFDFDGGLIANIGSYGNTEESEESSTRGPITKAIDRVYTDLFLVKEVIADKVSATYIQANYATIVSLDAVEAKIDHIVASEVTVAYLEANYAQIAYVNANCAAIDLANVKDAAIKTAMIDKGAVGTVQIAEGSITDAKILNLTANKITAGTLSVERLELIGSETSVVYALNNSGMLVSQSVNTIDGDVLTDRTITADKIVAKSITAGEIFAKTITANEITANTITAAEIASGTITATEISAGAITTTKIASGAITADKISVVDLYAIGAKIGGFTIGNTYIANGTTSLGTTNNSVYIGLNGISCGTNFIAKQDGTVTIRGNLYCNTALYMYSASSASSTWRVFDTGYQTENHTLNCYNHISGRIWQWSEQPDSNFSVWCYTKIYGNMYVSQNMTVAGNLSVTGNISSSNTVSGGAVTSSSNMTATNYFYGKSGCGDTHVPAVMSRTSNQISLYWNGSGCYIFIDRTMIGRIVTS